MAIVLSSVVLRVLHNLVLVRVYEFVIADDLFPGDCSNVGEFFLFIVRVVLLKSGLGVDKGFIGCNFVHVRNGAGDWFPRRYKVLTTTSRDVSTVFLSL